MSFDDEFNDFFDDFDIFKVIKRSQSQLEKMLRRITNGELKGNWEITQIDEPDMKGYTIRGRFGTEMPLQPLEPLDPLRPSKRRPLPEKPFDISKAALKEMREPLVDIFEDRSAVKIYVELPGVEKEDIKLNFGRGSVEVNAKNFYKEIQLPNKNIDTENASTEYKNGVLQVTVSKNKGLRREDSENLKAV